MKSRYRLVRRGSRGGFFYCVDILTGKRTTLGTNCKEDARRIIDAKNEAARQPMLNLQLAKAYLLGADGEMTKRSQPPSKAPIRFVGDNSRKTRRCLHYGLKSSWKPKRITC